MQNFRQEQRQTQSTLIAPQLRESLKVLQVSGFELRNAILDELQTNPTLEEMPVGDVSIEAQDELAESREADGETEGSSPEAQEMDFETDTLQALKQLDEDWREYYSEENAHGGRYSQSDEEKRKHFFESHTRDASLEEHLMGQLSLMDLEEDDLEILRFLIGSLDEQGFLTLSTKEAAHLGHFALDKVEAALDVLKTLDPTGIACASIQDSLLFQLERRGEGESRAAKMVRSHYKLLLRRRIPELASAMGISKTQAQEAIAFVGTLDPVPARNFRVDENHDVLPDVLVRFNNREWVVDLNSDHIPRLRISRAYKNLMLKENLNDKEREYLRDKMKSGKFLIHAIEQRQSTLLRISQSLVRHQQTFLEEGSSGLKPMTMGVMADELGIHETTVSRAIANKYIETPFGVYPLKFFFTSGYEGGDGESVSNTSVKKRIAEIIAREDPKKPLSDQKIVGILAKEKLSIARRTVAKYREELGILSTSMRRMY